MDFSLRWRRQLVTGGFFLSLLIVPLYLFSLKELSPIEDTSSIAMIVEAAPEASMEETVDGFVDAVDVMLSEPAATYIWQSINPGFGFGGQEFVSPDERDVTTHELLPAISERLKACQRSPRSPLRSPLFPLQVSTTSRSS